MLICKVIGCVVSTAKHEKTIGKKLMIVRELNDMSGKKSMIAVDCVGAGIGDLVLVTPEGGSARMASQCIEGSIDTAIIGIINN